MAFALVLLGACEGVGDGIRIDGSSTVYPLTEAVAEEFALSGARTAVRVGISGTGGGIEKFCRGELDIVNASREMRERERAACDAEGITDILELQVAIDALTVVVSPKDDWAQCLTVAEVRSIFAADGVTRWSEVRPGFPDEPIRVYHPGADSGTFDYFVEAIIGPDARHRSDGAASEDDNVLLQGVANDAYSIGYFGYAYYREAGQQLRAVAIDAGEGCVEPTYENAFTGDYKPLSRPLLLYTRESALRDPETLAFVDFYLANAAALAEEVGYIALTEEQLARQRAELASFAAPE